MIEITGRIHNAVDGGRYEIEAFPASDPRVNPEDCGCYAQLLGGALPEGTSRAYNQQVCGR